jgi:hypothetical protein
MMTLDAVNRAQELGHRREETVNAKWKYVTADDPSRVIGGYVRATQADEQLLEAIEEFRQRLLDAIDAELRELGVAPPSSLKEAS